MTIEELNSRNEALRDNMQDLQDLVIHQASRLINDNLYTKSLLSSLPVAFISTDKKGHIQVANKAAEEMLQVTLQSVKGTSLNDLFAFSPAIAEMINQAEDQKTSVSADSLYLTLADGQQKVVNVHVRLFYDEERRVFGTLLAMEDQTYISFLRESFKQHALTPSDGEIIAYSPKMKKVVKQLGELSKGDEPVLFSGPSGSGKTYLAAKLHNSRDLGAQAPMILLDCHEIDDDKFKESLFGSGENLQEDKRFIRFKSLHDYGTIHLAEGGTLILTNIDVLGTESLEALNEYIAHSNESSALPKCRIVATTKLDPEQLRKDENFSKELLNRFSGFHVQVPALNKRRKDILHLARLFLVQQEGEKNITKGAENGLLTKQYSQNNVRELKDAIELAVLVADGNTIQAEHIFTGPMEQGTDLEVDLTDFALTRFLIKDKCLAILRGGVLTFFMALICLTLFFPDHISGVIGNKLVWGPWWLFLVFGFLLIGRVWCTICPLSTAGRIASRIWSFTKPPPDFLKKSSPFLIPIGFVGIIWLEYSFHMITHPRPTGFLLVGLILLAILFALFFKRETWCRYLCPLGNFGGVFSLSATLFVRSNPNVCSTKCTTHNCNKGSEDYAGCPVFHHPLFARNAHICKLCFNCLKSCPHNSARLYLRPPLARVWQQADITDTLGFFGLVFFFLAPFLLASERIQILMGVNPFSLAALFSLLLAAICRYSLPTLLFGDDENKLLDTTRLSLVLLLLAWGPFAAFHFGHLAGLDTFFVVSNLQGLTPTQGISVLLLVQLSAIWFGTIIAIITLLGLSRVVVDAMTSITRQKSYLFIGVCLFYSILNSWIVL